METTDPKKQEEINELPDFVKDKSEANNFGETTNKEAEQESFPENGSQSITGTSTDNSKLQIEPDKDGDDSLA